MRKKKEFLQGHMGSEFLCWTVMNTFPIKKKKKNYLYLSVASGDCVTVSNSTGVPN